MEPREINAGVSTPGGPLASVFMPASLPADNVARTTKYASLLTGLTEEEAANVGDKYELVKAYKKALRRPAFMAEQIKARDCPVHRRWCSVMDAKNANTFLVDYIKRARETYPKVDIFDVFEELTIVFPTVATVDMFQMVNDRKSYKSDDLQWTGLSETYAKAWPELDLKSFVTSLAVRAFMDEFDDMEGLFALFEDLDERYRLAREHAETEEEADHGFLAEAHTMRATAYNGWFKRVGDSVSTLGDIRIMQRAMMTMVEYRLAFGMVPYEAAEKGKKSDQSDKWMDVRRNVPNPFSLIVLRNKRDNTYACWNYVDDNAVLLAHDPYGAPFDTKLVQLLKAEYTYAELFKKQNNSHMSNGYVLVEEKELPDAAPEGTVACFDEEDSWKRRLDDMDGAVKYNETGAGARPQPIALQGIAKPPRMPYLRGKGAVGGGRGYIERGVRGGLKGIRDPAEELVMSLQKKLTASGHQVEETDRSLRALEREEDANMKAAAVKLDQLLNTKKGFVAKINGNLAAVSREIKGMAGEGGGTPEGTFGLISVRKMLGTMSTSCNSMQDLVAKFEGAMTAVGIDPRGETETDMFREMDIRINVVSSTAIQRAQLELRQVMETVEKMLAHMENLMATHTSSLNAPASAQEHAGVDEAAFGLENFDDEFIGMLKGNADVTPGGVDVFGTSTDHRSDELYAEYFSKMKESNEMYVMLKKNYHALAKSFQNFQVETLADISKSAQGKAKHVDARKLAMVYKDMLAAQIKLNKGAMVNFDALLTSLENKISVQEANRQKDRVDALSGLEHVRSDLQTVLAYVEGEDGDIGSSFGAAEAMSAADGVISKIRSDRKQYLQEASVIFRKNLEELRTAYPILRARVDARREELRQRLSSSPPRQEAGGGPERADTALRSVERADDYNERASARYEDALAGYDRLVDQVDLERHKKLAEAKENEMKRKFKADAARADREAAIKEHDHAMTMKRYGGILSHRENAKRRRLNGGTDCANALVVEGDMPIPQMLTIKDMFRKAKIQPGVPEKHLKDLRSNLKDRWKDFVSYVFPSIIVVDNHGVKTWAMNYDSIMSSMVVPFMKLRYGKSIPLVPVDGSGTEVRARFFEQCDEFVLELLLNARDGQYKHLMVVFSSAETKEDHGYRPIASYDQGDGR